jgi:hypothetical protein
MKNIDGGELDIYSTLELDPCHKITRSQADGDVSNASAQR